nr:hypothetical protein [Flavisolibacter sp.]
ELLPFYNYSLDATAGEKMQLDSVIYKSQTAIVMHDLRNDWIDNMYMLWGASYYFLQEFDSASLMFQFINYAFAEKEKDGYYKYIGSRMDGNNALSISTKEDDGFFKKAFTTSPSRNEAFIWQIRSLIQMGNLTYAGSLIATLKNDPLFPERLHNDLEEVQAYWFYKQNIWDSSATHLVKALSQAKSKQEKARWEYLAAQMFERAGKPALAHGLYADARAHATDPVMDVYARMNLVRLNDQEAGDLDKNIGELVKMAKRSKYEDYRDVIYYMAAQMELERKNFPAAKEYLLKATQYNNSNLASRNNSFLQIADLAYDQKDYIQAAAYYDSLQVVELSSAEIKRVNERKAGLAKVIRHESILARQDSLQRIAAMPEEERNAYINKLVKELRKQQGLKDDNNVVTGGRVSNNTTTGPNLFDNQAKGDWYFYNATLKTQGQNQFKQTWGNRPNTDNWRRFSSVSSQLIAKTNANNSRDVAPLTNTSAELGDEEELSYTALLSKLPIDPSSKYKSDDSIMNALFNLGVVFINDLEDYPSAIDALETLLSRFPSFAKTDEALFHLYYAYTKAGDHGKAAQIKNLLAQKHAGSRFTAIVNTGKDPEAKPKINPQSTKDYEAIYDMFLEGKFDAAKQAKKIADSTYQTNYWQPQLLYIEAVYHVKQREDSVAIQLLQTLYQQNQGSPLAEKATTMIQVLQRRKEIEEELKNLRVERPAEDTMITIRDLVKTTVVPPVQTIDSVKKTEPVVQETQPPSLVVKNDNISREKKQPITINPVTTPTDTLSKRPVAILQRPTMYGYSFDPNDAHLVLLVLDKVDVVFSGEARNAFNRYNRDKHSAKTIGMDAVELSADKKLVMIGPFLNAQEAVDYMDLVKRLAPSEIIPWLKADKYGFLILSTLNLPVLKENKDLTLYRKFLEKNLPGKF